MADYCPPQVDVKLFNCSHHQLTDIPHRLHPETQSLDLSHNQIAILHEDSFADYRRLTKLVLDFNRIYKITDRALNPIAPTLEYLSLRGNRLSFRAASDFPMSSLAKLRRLRHLDLSENPLGIISSGWFTPLGGSLQVLRLAHLVGQFELQSNAFFGLGHLEDFDFSNNGFRNLPDNAFAGIRPEKLKRLNLRDIPWHCDCKLLWLRHWLARITVSTLPYELPITGPCLTPKELGTVPLISLPMTIFQCPPKLQAMHSSAPHYFGKGTNSVFVSPSVGESISLNCSFVSQPKMFVGWYKNGVLLRPELKRFKQTIGRGTQFTALLTIVALRIPEDNGNYTCNSENSRGTAKGIFYLKVFNHPKDAKLLRDEAAPAITHSFPHDLSPVPDTPRIFFLALAIICICVLCGVGLLIALLLFHWKKRRKLGRLFLSIPDARTIDTTQPIENKGVIDVAPQGFSASSSLSPPSMSLEGPSPPTSLFAPTPVISHVLTPVLMTTSNHFSPSPQRYAPPPIPESPVREKVYRPVVRTFAPFESYEQEDGDEEEDSLSLDEESSGGVDKACPVHGSRAKNDANFCPIHSQQSLDARKPSGHCHSTEEIEMRILKEKATPERRWNTLEYHRKSSNHCPPNGSLPRGHRMRYNSVTTTDLVYKNSVARDC